MKQVIISLHQNVSQKLINSKNVFALNVEQARELAKETFKPARGQWVGAEVIQNKSIHKNKK